MRVLVLGAGIAGLSAAYFASRAGHEVVLLEASDRTGGLLRTEREAGFLLEAGPDCFIVTKPEAVALARDLGIEGELIGTSTEHRRSFILSERALVPVPEGFYLVAPASARRFMTSELLSWAGRLRVALEPYIRPRAGEGDETLASFVERRLGREMLDRVAGPMVSGIYSADPRRLSLQATMPQLLEMEREHGSVIRALALRPTAGSDAASGPRYGLFATWPDGMERLARALVAALPQGVVRTGARVRSLERRDRELAVELATGEVVCGDRVVVALPAAATAHALEGFDPTLAREVASIPHASVATLNLGFRVEHVRHPLDGMGFLVPAAEKRSLTACTFSSRKFPGRAPAGHVLLRAFIGGALGIDAWAQDDERLIASVLRDLDDVLGLEGKPVVAKLSRWADASPQYHLGHLERVAAIEARVARTRGLALAGSAYRGVGIPDCIASARAAVTKVLAD